MRNAFVVRAAIAYMLEEAGRYMPRETGGLLLSYWTEDDDVVVAKSTGPGPRARQSPFGYEPDQEADFEIIRKTIESTSGAITYGELLGAFMALMMALDVYPFVPSEGFSLGRKVRDVFAATAWGAVVGGGIGALSFAFLKVVKAARSILWP